MTDSLQQRSKLDRLRTWLLRPADAASLGAFRIMFGALMFWEVIRFFQHGWIREYYVDPALHFKYLFFEWVHAWPGVGMYVHFAVLGALAVLIALGLFYRLAAALFFLGFSYVFLLDQGRYLNHFYLISLVAFLMIWVGADRWASLDQRLFRRGEPQAVPFWQIFLLRAQVFIVYFYAGVAKINPDWLRGEPVRTWLALRAEATGWEFLAQEWAVWVVAYGGLLFDLSIGFLLIWRPTLALGIVLAVLFHTGNRFLFQIGIFPYLGVALTLLFLPPEWPGWFGRETGAQSGDGPEPADAPPAGRVAPTKLGSGRALAFMAVYLAAQLLIPLRHWLYPGDVAWTEEGHRFSWRMKLRDKQSVTGILVRDPGSGQEWEIDPNVHLPPWQFDEMMGRPDMLVQFAHYLRDLYRPRCKAEPEVYASVLCSLNGAPERELIDPNVNLAAEKRTLWSSSWILPRAP
jgi:hypothetical protein